MLNRLKPWQAAAIVVVAVALAAFSIVRSLGKGEKGAPVSAPMTGLPPAR